MAYTYYYFKYKTEFLWSKPFSLNLLRTKWNELVNKIDLQNPNFISEKNDISLDFDLEERMVGDALPALENKVTISLKGFVTDKPNPVSGQKEAFINATILVTGALPEDDKLYVNLATAQTILTLGGDTIEKAAYNAFKISREDLIKSVLILRLRSEGIEIKNEEPFVDPEPALPGPPTQTISGVTNKPPVVDNPNVKLPSQEVKSLTATSATEAVGQAKSSVTNTTNQAQGAATGAVSQAQGAATGAVSQAQGAATGAVSQAQGAASGTLSEAKSSLNKAQDSLNKAQSSATSKVTSAADKLNPKGLTPDGLGKDWSPDKFSPQSIAGNTKFVDPKTGTIGSTSTLAKTLGGAALGGGIGAGIGAIAGGGQGALIGGLSGGAIGAGAALGGVTGTVLAGVGLGGGIGAAVGGTQGALIGAASGGVVGAAAAKLASVQKGMPKPKIPKPLNTPRIKTVKIPRPDSTKGAQALLNLPKSSTF